MDFSIEQLLAAWLETMLDLHASDVRDFDPGQTATPDKIWQLFVANGWSTWNGGRYTENSKTSWCGHTMGATGQRLGAHLGEPGEQVVFPVGLDPQIALYCYPSTKRLGNAHKWNAAGVPEPVLWRPAGNNGQPVSTDGRAAERWADVILPGMTVCVKTSGKDKRHGDHVVCVRKVDDDGVLHTVEGNGRGWLADGTWGEGVVIRDERTGPGGQPPRTVDDIRMVVELSADDHFEDWTRHNDEAIA